MPPAVRASNLSVVMIARNERAHLRRTLENLLDTVPPRSEVLVVDDGSTDGSTRFLHSKRPPARLLEAKNLGVAGARNFGAAHATGNTLIFCDAHIWLQPGWWEPLVERIADPRVGGAAPTIIDAKDRDRQGFGLYLPDDSLAAEWLDFPGKRPRRAPILPGCCLAMRRDVFDAVGGFDDGMICSGGVDNELCLRLWLLGYEQWIEPSVEVLHLLENGPDANTDNVTLEVQHSAVRELLGV